ncbi:hypothetical protein [Pontibacter mangrovi]|uniref:Uncharacterized protein n=1 Tax=Pontibacter mangrovi TaxID=2589816 RepID=A0A501WBV4_9BACT|nr:hypothetical protein [Pontibacter mangrovi]TPE42976.1 hypothetical protein FJM65_15120 [Pontibacter mangrovi]
MKLIGNIRDIKHARENKNQDIELHISRVEYITHKKDGRFFQPFDLEVELEEPIIITGDRLARVQNKLLEEGEYEFEVYDKEDEAYVLNPDKQLSLSIEYDFDADITILSSLYYTVTVSNEEFKELKAKAHKDRKKKGRR